jgi:diketogulonate reductase-like aldo/keto reductase
VSLRSIADRVEVAPGIMMPRLGMGTWPAHGAQLERAIGEACALGYRLFDTSANYHNETEVGIALRRSGVSRDELFVTTKLEEHDQAYDRVRPALESSLRRLGMDYVDLYLIHWPYPARTNEAWQALEELRDAGLTRSIGVSNFETSDLTQVFETATVPPAVNQIELHPHYQRRALAEECRRRGITVEAWGPVMRGHASRVPELVAIGNTHGKTAEQVCLRWLLEQGMIAIPKSVHAERLRENADVYDFALTSEQVHVIAGLDRGAHVSR